MNSYSLNTKFSSFPKLTNQYQTKLQQIYPTYKKKTMKKSLQN